MIGDKQEGQEKVNDIRKDYPDLYNQLQKKEIGYRKEDFRTVYLILHNLFMYVGFMYVFLILIIRYIKEGSDFFPETYKTVGNVMLFMHLIQCLEILYPIFGYTKGGPLVPLVQVGGRNAILLCCFEVSPKIQVMPVAFYLFFVWSCIEVIRYPYYMFHLLKKENGFLTWLRYSAWIILYPIGFLCEWVALFRTIIFLEQTLKYSFILPYFDIRVGLATVAKVHLLFFFIPTVYLLTKHLYKARKAKLGPKEIRKNKKLI